jgi:hypothetical protein
MIGSFQRCQKNAEIWSYETPSVSFLMHNLNAQQCARSIRHRAREPRSRGSETYRAPSGPKVIPVENTRPEKIVERAIAIDAHHLARARRRGAGEAGDRVGFQGVQPGGAELLEYRNYLENAWWDIIVIDECQNVAARAGEEGVSRRARLARMLATRSDTLILLSATPHDGSARSFASLMSLLDPPAISDPDNYTHA